MNDRSLAVLTLFLVLSFSAFAQRQPLALCIVQTKPNPNIQYDPSAGPYAIAMYKQLQGHFSAEGTPLNIIVLASSVDKEILPEVRRLRCSSVLQLWFHRNADKDIYGGSPSVDGSGDPEPGMTFPQPIGDQTSLIFALWDAGTHKVFARGAAPLVHAAHLPGEHPILTTEPYIALRDLILSKLKTQPSGEPKQ
jgi:hypothetical protein